MISNLLHVLIIEDSPMDVELYKRCLLKNSEREFVFFTSDNVEEALFLYESSEPDVILLDYELPDDDGLSLLKKIGQSESMTQHKTAVIMITGQGDEEIAVEAMKNGAHDYVTKSQITPKGLTQTVEKSLEKVGLLRKLERQREELQQFSYITVHDLKTPIGNIEVVLNMLKKNIREDNQEAVKNVEILQKLVLRARSAISDLVSVIQTQHHAQEIIEHKPVNLEEILSEILVSLKTNIQESGASIQSDFTEVPIVNYPPPILRSILQNLISNSIKYRSPDRTPEVLVKTTKNGKLTALTVQDNGMGIDLKKNKDKLFKMFQRFHSHVEGSGIGLYSINKLVESQGGKIEVESEFGAGSLFRVYL